MTGGLTNGGAVTITGGRIGSVALTAAQNTFTMSGGQIDTNLTAGSGDTNFKLSGGAIGGAVTLGNGANTIAVTGDRSRRASRRAMAPRPSDGWGRSHWRDGVVRSGRGGRHFVEFE